MKKPLARSRGPVNGETFRGLGAGILLMLLAGGVSLIPGAFADNPGRLWLAQFNGNEPYTVRQGFPRDGSRFEVYDRSGRRAATIRERPSGIGDRWDIYDEQGRRVGEARGNGSSIAPRWDIYDERGRRTGTVRETGSSVAPRWDVYDAKGRRTGTVRPGPLETDYFRERREQDPSAPPVPFIPPVSPRGQAQAGGVSRPEPSGGRRWPVPGPWIQPPALPGGGVGGMTAPPGWMPMPPVPPIPPIPPVPPVPPVTGVTPPGNPYYPAPPSGSNPGYGPGMYQGNGPASPYEGYSQGNTYQGYSHGNTYEGYGHGNPYSGYGHGGLYSIPPTGSR